MHLAGLRSRAQNVFTQPRPEADIPPICGLSSHTRAWSSFAPPTRRMPLGQSQASPELIPEEGSSPGSDIA
jgi:hypothetical protein